MMINGPKAFVFTCRFGVHGAFLDISTSRIIARPNGWYWYVSFLRYVDVDLILAAPQRTWQRSAFGSYQPQAWSGMADR